MKKPMMYLLLAGAVVVLAGCSTASAVRVHPWERGTLADYTMNPGRDPIEIGMMDHVFTSREAASGGSGVGGAGCGCN